MVVEPASHRGFSVQANRRLSRVSGGRSQKTAWMLRSLLEE
jgi:hypothetical protein